MKIKGLQKLTLLDFPGELAATVFLGGCNFRCPFCHNASIVLPERESEKISEEDLFDFLSSRRTRLGGVCVSGGEPTVSDGIVDFISKIKSMGYRVKLDTNGYRPAVLSELISSRLVDYVAMDIKNSKERYGESVGIKDLDLGPIEESAALLMRGGVDFEFRTTLVRELHSERDIQEIGKWLAGDEKFFLQGFVDSGDLLGGGMSAPTDAEILRYAEILRGYIKNAKARIE